MKITQKDIANKLGVSVSLVSRVLSGQADKIGANKFTVETILSLAKSMNYIPSSAALALKGKKIKTIGVVVYDFEDEYFSLLIKNLQKLSHEYDYSLILVGFLNRIPKEEDLVPLRKHSIDGIIILGSFGDLAWTSAFSHLPIAKIGHGKGKNIQDTIALNEIDAMQKIINYLNKDLGFKDIYFAGKDRKVHLMRKKIFKGICTKMDINFESFTKDGTEFEAGKSIAKDIISSGKLPQAIVSANDIIAMGIISEFYKNGIKVPQDVSIIGFDNIVSASNYIPPISSFSQPIEEFAREAFESVIKRTPRQKILIKGDLVLRQSSKKL